MEKIILLVLIIGVIFIGRRTFLQKVTVFEYERGLRYTRGKFVNILSAGQYFICPFFSNVIRIDVRSQLVTIPGQEVLSADNVTLKVSLAANYQVVDPATAVNQFANYKEAMYVILQLGLREIVGQTKIDDFLGDRALYTKKLFELTESKVAELGLKLISVDMKDIMFPGELKKVFAQVVQAQKEGLAVLEKARGETATLRHLANAAQMVKDNPILMQLRLLQSSGNTVVWGMPAEGVLPVKK